MINAVDIDSPVHNGELNFGTMRPLIEPLTTAFGEMRRKSEYLFGCKLNFPLDVRGEMIRVALIEEDGTEKIVDIGRTPEGFDPASEHMVAQAAGDVGEYLMIMQTPGNRPDRKST